VDAFQNNPKCQVILCNIQSGGVGITLTSSSRVAFIELPWHPAHADQAEDRAWRIGQKNSVQCTYLLGKDTIDEYIYNIIEKKRAMVAQVTGAENDISTEHSMVDDLIGMFTKNV
jgi:SWI/SNF-related matrix-associated actin-dependent regulator 1 of chromatin subfamily A